MRGIFPRSRKSQMRGTEYAWHMLYMHKLTIYMFYDIDDLKVIVDT